jgi:antitoxin PrlF
MHSHYLAAIAFSGRFPHPSHMSAALELESTLTDRYQTTVPNAVRRALKLGKRDKLRYIVQPDGSVHLARADQQDKADPVLDEFLDFLARDLKRNPQRIRSIDPKWVKRIRSLVRDVKVDLDKPLSPDDE